MFKPRKILKSIQKYLGKQEVIVIHGARQTGKTTVLKIIKDKLITDKGVPESYIFYFDLEDFTYLDMFNKGHREIIAYLESRLVDAKKSKVFLLIDEIQYLDNPSSLLKILHDHYEWIQVIVSGSSSFQIKSKFKDSLAGRTVDFELFPLDFEEFITFKGVFFDLLSDKTFSSDLANTELAGLFKEYLIYGGYPKVVLTHPLDEKTFYLKQVIDTYVKKDIRDLGHIRDVNRFNKLLKILADRPGGLLNVLEISSTAGVARATVEDYLFIMENTYIIKILPPFFSNARTEIAKMPKILFEDTGLANLLKYGFFLDKIEGALFENSVYCFARSIFGRECIKYWRTKQKTEIDLIADMPSLKLAIESKISYPQKAMESLSSFLDKYSSREAWIISLEKSHPGEKDKRIKELYPWEMYAKSLLLNCKP